MVKNHLNEIYSIKTENLTKRFDKKKHRGFFGFMKKNQKNHNYNKKNDVIVALNKVNLKIRTGELFGLLGPNGSGKTTMIKCLSTILIPDEGRISVNGYDVKKETSKVRASLGMVVGGERTLYWKLTARDNLRYFASLYKIQKDYAEKRIEELLEIFQLSERADERLEDYSTGMRQKITIARALLHDPPILLLDEPTLGLDPGFSRQIRSKIKELTKEHGKTVLLTTHYMDEADKLCDRVALINKGNIVTIKTPNDLKAMVKEKEIVEIIVIQPPPNIEKKIYSQINGIEVVKLIQMQEKEKTSKIKIIGDKAEEKIGSLIDLLRKSNTQICSINIGTPTLEDVFIKLTA